MPKILGANMAERAFREVGERIGKPSPCGPPEGQGADDKTGEKRGATLFKNREDVANAFKGGG